MLFFDALEKDCAPWRCACDLHVALEDSCQLALTWQNKVEITRKIDNKKACAEVHYCATIPSIQLH